MFKVSYADRMTVEQLAVMKEMQDSLRAETILVGQNLDRARAAVVPLPATAASGEPVLHGANQQIRYLVTYWADRLSLIRRWIDDSQINNILREAGVKERV